MSTKRVLVVEDHPPTVTLIRTALEITGCEVSWATNGAECLLAVEHQVPDLIILDVAMPVMDGFQTLRVLREKEETRSLPVVILSVRRDEADVLKGLHGGADIYMTKPFDVDTLVAVVEEELSIRAWPHTPEPPSDTIN